jgi:predicted naringenin-chalcone synthase
MNKNQTAAIIESIGTAVPQNKIFQQHHHSILESANGISRAERLFLKKVYANSGIESRHSVLKEFGFEDQPSNKIFHPAGTSPPVAISARMELFELYASDLCAEAILNCVNGNENILSEVTHLITFSCTGMSAPGIDIQLIEKLNLSRGIERTCINFMGCYAAINALKTANYIIRAQPEAVVLLSGVELCTLHYQKNNTQDQVIANAIFADGAAAVIVRSATEKNNRGFILDKFYSEFEPAGLDDMAWRIGNYGFDIRLSTYVPDLIRNNISSLIEKLFLRAGIGMESIDHYAIHPGGIKILEACEDALGISSSDNRFSYNVLNQFGNMSSVTILFVLKKYLDAINELKKGAKILSCAFGPGLTMETMIVNVT